MTILAIGKIEKAIKTSSQNTCDSGCCRVVLVERSIRRLDTAAALGEGKKLYDVNKEVYRLLRYCVKEKTGAGEVKQTIWLIDWKNSKANHFAIAEEVSIKGENLSPKTKLVC